MAKEVWEGYAPGGGRQPNFVQKLYNFLALDPHPCPEVIYWASDSRQLVIAQPDRLVKEVLPKLFKHGKLSSFGRQLNMYGFSRLFPGRQFKDANGNVSDASVWAHPTLHRLSTPLELSTIKRRAAPKLFRTRRLANGQIIRSRAGPAVEAKFREVRENIAESRRQRGLGVDVEASTYAEGQTKRLENIEEVVEANDVSTAWLGGDDWGRRASLLSTTTAGSDWAPEWASGMNASMAGGSDIPSYPPTGGNQHQPDFSVLSNAYSTNPVYVSPQALPPQLQPQAHTQAQVSQHLHPPLVSMQPSLDRTYQSCPASLHTSPFPSRAQLIESWNCFDQAHPPVPSVQASNPMYPNKITAPAAPSPFQAHIDNQDFMNTTATDFPNRAAAQGTVSDPPTRFVSTTATPYPQTKQLDLNFMANLWHNLPRTIDPRWVSPNSSMWSTPAMTPRTGSPLQQEWPHVSGQKQSHLPVCGVVNPHLSVVNNDLGTQSYPPRVLDRRGIVSPDESVSLAFPGIGNGGTQMQNLKVLGGVSI